MSGFILQCRRCGWFHAYKIQGVKLDAIKGGDYRIDTNCGVCGLRLRHTHKRQGWKWHFSSVAPAYAKGSGAHNRTSSVFYCRQVARSQVNIEVMKLNKKRQLDIAKKDGFSFEEE